MGASSSSNEFRGHRKPPDAVEGDFANQDPLFALSNRPDLSVRVGEGVVPILQSWDVKIEEKPEAFRKSPGFMLSVPNAIYGNEQSDEPMNIVSLIAGAGVAAISIRLRKLPGRDVVVFEETSEAGSVIRTLTLSRDEQDASSIIAVDKRHSW